MIKKIPPLILFLLAIFSQPLQAWAQEESVYIEDFKSNIVVNQDGYIDITEEITYQFGQNRHGMYRDIPISYKLESGEMQYLKIELLDIQYNSPSSDSRHKRYTAVKDLDYYRIRIGDPNTYIKGTWVYTISYRIKYLVESYPNLDKLYLNILGDTWEEPIHKVSATITMPSKIEEAYCYTGVKSSVESDCLIEYLGENKIEIISDKVFKKGESLTVTNTVAPGTIVNLNKEKSEYNAEYINTIEKGHKIQTFLSFLKEKEAVILVGILFFFVSIIFIIIFISLLRKKDLFEVFTIRKYLPNTIPQYNIPQGWYILKLAVFLEDNIGIKAISAQIIQLCVYGYLKIRKEERILYIERADKAFDTLIPSLKDFCDGLMQGKSSIEIRLNERSSTALLTTGKGEYDEKEVYSDTLKSSIQITQDKISQDLVDEEYFLYDKNKREKTSVNWRIILLPILIFGSIIAGFLSGSVFLAVLGFPISILIIAVFPPIMAKSRLKELRKKYSVKGNTVLKEIHGLHMYIKTAEEQKIRFHSDPSKYGGTFESLLPYAIFFGIEKKWIQLFDSIPLTWLISDSTITDFGIDSVSSSLSSFVSSSISSSTGGISGGGSDSGGSSGGSSGGGGGGGGGGSW